MTGIVEVQWLCHLFIPLNLQSDALRDPCNEIHNEGITSSHLCIHFVRQGLISLVAIYYGFNNSLFQK